MLFFDIVIGCIFLFQFERYKNTENKNAAMPDAYWLNVSTEIVGPHNFVPMRKIDLIKITQNGTP